MADLYESYVARLGFKFTTPGSAVRRAAGHGVWLWQGKTVVVLKPTKKQGYNRPVRNFIDQNNLHLPMALVPVSECRQLSFSV